MTYRAPVKDMLFVMKELANIDAVAQMPGFEDAGLTPPRPCSKNAPSSTRTWLLR